MKRWTRRLRIDLAMWRAPIAIAVVTMIGLIAALVGNGVWDAVSWVGLGVPVAVAVWYGLIRRMNLDTVLACVHHLLAFAIPALIAAEWGMLTLVVMDLHWIRRLARLDAAYGICALAIVVIGTLRVIYGAKGADFYLGNHAFWAKIIAFAIVGLLSIAPTVTILSWRRTSTLPRAASVVRTRRWLTAELAVFATIPVFAALMARGVGF